MVDLEKQGMSPEGMNPGEMIGGISANSGEMEQIREKKDGVLYREDGVGEENVKIILVMIGLNEKRLDLVDETTQITG